LKNSDANDDKGEEEGTAIVRACKCISKKQQSLDETERELDIMKKLVGQPLVSQLLDVYEAPDRLFLISELCEGGELYSQIIDRANEDESRPFTEREAAIIMKQVLTAVGMLHDNLIVHRDVKPENLLLRSSDGSLDDLVLIDFGLSRFFEPGQRLTTRVGTVYYTAPEVWTERYDNKCDLFSCGVLLYVLLCLYTPFDGDDDNDILRKVMRGKFAFPDEEWSGISDDAKDFIKKLMSKYPRRRPSALEALEHPWFTSAMGGGDDEAAAAETDLVVEDAP
jgi:calcium-dependent protein kinase